MEERKDHYETCDCDDCIFQGRSCAMFRKDSEKCDEFVSYTTKKRVITMTRAEEIQEVLKVKIPIPKGGRCYADALHCCWFEDGVKYADSHPSDETIMLILNCIGYEEKSWVEFVRKELEKRK